MRISNYHVEEQNDKMKSGSYSAGTRTIRNIEKSFDISEEEEKIMLKFLTYKIDSRNPPTLKW